MKNFKPELVGATSDKGPVRSANEDAYWVSHKETPTEFGALYIVADGVGGQEAGDVAANKATAVISEAFYNHRQDGTEIQVALEYAIRTANHLIFDLSQSLGKGKMGCTIVTAVFHEGYLYVAHVGDARAYLLMGNQLKQLTRDDTWVQKQVDAGVLTAQEAAEHELRNVVTQVLGNKEEIDVHLTKPLELHSNDRLLLCSDGLYDPLNDEQIQRLLQGKVAQGMAEDLVKASINAKTHDNVTAVVVDAGPVPGKVRPIVPSAKKRKRKVPAWVFATLVVTLILIVAFVLLFVLPNTGFGQSGAATDVPVVDVATETVPEVVPAEETEIATETAAPEEIETAVPRPVATAAGSVTPEPLPSNTPAPTDTSPPPLEDRACLVSDSFLWSEQQLESGSCDEFAGVSIEAGEEIRLLQSEPRLVNGPDSSCQQNSFLHIQSVAEPSIEGWVLATNLQPIAPGASCTP